VDRPPPGNQLGSSTVSVTAMGFGGAPIGNLFHRVHDERAAATVAAALDVGVGYFDTAPHYGLGLSEERLGRALAAHPSAVVSTKVGRRLVDNPDGAGSTDLANGFDVPARWRREWDFSADGVRRSLDDSLRRLGRDRIDVALIHDPDESPDPDRAVTGAYPALAALRREGIVGAIGVGSKDLATLARFAADTDVDAIMVAGRYTLLEQPALDEVLPICQRRGISVLVAGAFNSGLLAVETPDETRTYEYAAVPPAVLARARAMAAVCARHGVTLPQAALAFAGGHPAVASVVVGADDPDQVRVNAARHAAPRPPADLWTELIAEGLLRPDAPLPA
jgi:D-threo-aldose 1-dehydrogenase